MNIIKTDLACGGYATLPNSTIRDPGLKLESLGALLKIQSRPEDWKISPQALQRECGVGRDKLRKIFRELEECGYMVRTKKRQADGTWSWFYKVFAESQHLKDYSGAGFPTDGRTAAGTQGHKLIKKTKTSLTRDDFLLSDELRTWAAKHAPLVEPDHETSVYREHPSAAARQYCSQEELHRDWKTWMKRGQQYASKQHRAPAARQAPRRPAFNDLADTSWLRGTVL